MNKTKKKKIKIWVFSIIFIFFIYLLSCLFVSYVDDAREHGGGGLSAYVTAGNNSQYDMVQPLNTFFAVFSTLVFSLLFSYAKRKGLKTTIPLTFSFILFIVGFFLSLGYIIFMRGTASVVGYSKIYFLVRMGFFGVGFSVLPFILNSKFFK